MKINYDMGVVPMDCRVHDSTFVQRECAVGEEQCLFR